MVQLSPDTRLDGWDGCSAYHYSDSIIYGFSHTHLLEQVVLIMAIFFMPTIKGKEATVLQKFFRIKMKKQMQVIIL